MNRTNNYIKITFRSLWRNKTFTLLNLWGLAVGTGTCLILFLLIRGETDFDTFHTKGDRIYRVTSAWTGGPQGAHFHQGVPIPLPDAVRREFPALEKVAAVWGIVNAQFTIPHPGIDDKKFKLTEGVFYTEPALFSILDYPWLAGNPTTGLTQPNTAAIDATIATSWFGDWRTALGKTVMLDHLTPLIITGILKDPPSNTDLPLRIAVSYATFPDRNDKSWHEINGTSTCYALLAKGQSINAVIAQVPGLIKKYFPGEDDAENSSIYFQPLKEVHLDARLGTYTGKRTPKEVLWSLSLIGFFLLLVGCINFINLATAQSAARAKEIGVRKVLGSTRGKLIRQFLLETSVITFFALILGCILAELALPSLRTLLGKSLYLDPMTYPSIFVFLIGIGITIVFLAGFYPGLVLSGFDPATALKSKMGSAKPGGISLRRGLVIFQFSLAQLMMIGMLVIVRQLDFFRHMPLGFDKEAIALVDLPTDSLSQIKFGYLKEKVLALPGVLSASLCNDAPSAKKTITTSFTFDNRPNIEAFPLIQRMADTDYLRTFHMTLVAGRLPFRTDSLAGALLNETAVRQLGCKAPGDILGKTINLPRNGTPIVGVVRDFNSHSLQEAIKPLVIYPDRGWYSLLAIKLDPSHMQQTMTAVAAAWNSVYPDYVYDQHYLDDNLAQFYTFQESLATILKVFAGLAIFISCLGLYGLVAFMAVQKTKEVGIRKVLGASVRNIVFLFSREFTLLIGLAFLIAAPLGYYCMHLFLINFYYRIKIGWDIFALSLATSVIIAWITVGYKAVRAATANPLRALKHE